MAQAAKGSQDDWSLGENEQCRHIIDKILHELNHVSPIRNKDLDKLISKLTKYDLLNEEKFRYKKEDDCRIQFQKLICDGGIDRNSWTTRDTLMYWVKDIKRNFAPFLEKEKELVLEWLKRSTPVSKDWLTENVTLDPTNLFMGECLSLAFGDKHIKAKLKKQYDMLYPSKNRKTFEKEFGSLKTAKWNPVVFHLSANAFDTTVGVFHVTKGRVLESRFYPHAYEKSQAKPIVYFALTGVTSYTRIHPDPHDLPSKATEIETDESDEDMMYREIKHKDAKDRSKLERVYVKLYEESQENTKKLDEMQKERDTIQTENASLKDEIRSVRQHCQILQTQLNEVFQRLDKMETKSN